jgi:hypothetical protein
MIVREAKEREKRRAPMVDAKRQLDTLQKRVERLKELYVLGEIDLNEYRHDKAELLQQIETIEVPQEVPSDSRTDVSTLVGLNLEEIYTNLSKEDKRRFWRSILGEIRFDKDRNIFVSFR